MARAARPKADPALRDPACLGRGNWYWRWNLLTTVTT